MLTVPANKVGIEPIFDPDMIGSLYVPEQAKERCDQGIVKYVGGDCELVKVGDHVLFSGYTGTLIKVDGELIIIVPEEFISAIVYDEPKEVSGLYFKDKEGNYFNATHEQAAYLLARAMENDPTIRPSRKRYKIEGAPKVEDYTKLR
jgi:co-chaperonin GroES (HSP10)